MATIRVLCERKQDKSSLVTADGFEGVVTAETLAEALSRAEALGKPFAYEDIPLGKLLQDKLLGLGFKVSCAESLTGGALASEIVRYEGASRVFDESVVTYGNTAKAAMLGVDPSVIASLGVVSAEVAKQMAEGVARLTGCDLALSTTGIAGPWGDGKCDVVGLTYIGVATRRGTTTYMHLFEGDRDDVRRQAVLWALFHGVEQLDKIIAAQAD